MGEKVPAPRKRSLRSCQLVVYESYTLELSCWRGKLWGKNISNVNLTTGGIAMNPSTTTTTSTAHVSTSTGISTTISPRIKPTTMASTPEPRFLFPILPLHYYHNHTN